MNDNYSPDQVEWNLSYGLVSEIQNLLNNANRYYLNGNIAKAFWCLKATKFRFIQSLEKEERKDLVTYELDFYKNQKEGKRNRMAYLYEQYNEQIMDLLESYGYLIPKKKDSKRIS